MPWNKRLLILLWRGLRWRCPVCGEGKVFQGIFKTYEHCPSCGFEFEREPGYYTGAMAVNLVLSELLIAAVTLPLAVNLTIPMGPLLAWGLSMPILLPIIFYRHTKTIWMSIDHMLHPVSNERIFFPE
ncbi:MAG TPA: DUF983 domain-containing protein [Ktedonobacteraceae bacterium]|nr:DUF983 domain-containing protein [Ktedonobacteraceae bacterium]